MIACMNEEEEYLPWYCLLALCFPKVRRLGLMCNGQPELPPGDGFSYQQGWHLPRFLVSSTKENLPINRSCLFNFRGGLRSLSTTRVAFYLPRALVTIQK